MKLRRKRFHVSPAPGFRSLYIRKTPRRNEQCDCGSKVKYKNCCGRRRDMAVQEKVIDINTVYIKRPGPSPQEKEPTVGMFVLAISLIIFSIVILLLKIT